MGIGRVSGERALDGLPHEVALVSVSVSSHARLETTDDARVSRSTQAQPTQQVS